MGRTYVEPPPFDLEKSFNDSNCCSPLIFILSAGSDPMSGLVKFSMEKKVVSFETISLGQGQVRRDFLRFLYEIKKKSISFYL